VWFLIIDVISPPDKIYTQIAKISPTQLRELFTTNKTLENNFEYFFSYKDPTIKKAIWLLKYKKHKDIGKLLGKTIFPIIEEKLENLLIFENFTKPLLIPIPISKARRKERGFNQCEVVLEEVSKNLPEDYFEYRNDALLKTKETESQARTKNKKERLENLKNCFWANEKIIRGRNVVIFDDVVTTGATIEEAKRTLERAGAKNIKIISIAH
jgi:ComF family protein